MDQQPISAFKNVNGTILHLGAGECSELSAYLRTAAEKIVLVEPNPDAAHKLKQSAINQKRVRVIQAAVSTEEGIAKLYHYNFDELATLHPAKASFVRWPGLREVNALEVQVLPLPKLLAKITFSEDKKHWLVIEAGGEEQYILGSLADNEKPVLFSYLSIYVCSETSYYSKERSRLLRDIEAAGYRLVHVVANAEGYIYHARLDTVQLALKKANEELERYKSIIKELRIRQRELETSLKVSKEKSQGVSSFSQDASIDNLIADIKPFFYGRSITYMDVGAFIGEVFLKISQSPDIRVRETHLIEPSPESYNKLIENLKGSKVSKIHTYNLAISATPGDKKIAHAKSMSKLVHGDDLDDVASNVHKVKSATLDSLREYVTEGHVNLLKLDVEGSEIDVLKSASSLLSGQAVDLIYIEVGFNKSGLQQVYFGDVDEYLQERGYRVFGFYEFTKEWIEDSPLLRRCNALYMSNRFSARNHYKASIEILQLKEKLSEMNKGQED